MIERLRQWALKNVVNAPVSSDIVTVAKDKTHLLIDNEKITDAELANLHAEYLTIRKFRLWNLVTNTIRDQAKKMMFENAKSYDDMLAGKMMLYVLSVQENVLENIEGQYQHMKKQQDIERVKIGSENH